MGIRINKISKSVYQQTMLKNKKAWSFSPENDLTEKLKWHPERFSVLNTDTTKKLMTVFSIYMQINNEISYTHDSCVMCLMKENLLTKPILDNNNAIEELGVKIKEELVGLLLVLNNTLKELPKNQKYASDIGILSKLNYEFTRMLVKTEKKLKSIINSNSPVKSKTQINLKGHYLSMYQNLMDAIDILLDFVTAHTNSNLRKEIPVFSEVVSVSINLLDMYKRQNNHIVRNYKLLF